MRRERVLAEAIKLSNRIGSAYAEGSYTELTAGVQVALCDGADTSGLDHDESQKIADLRAGAAGLREDRTVFILTADAAFLVGRVLRGQPVARDTEPSDPSPAPGAE